MEVYTEGWGNPISEKCITELGELQKHNAEEREILIEFF